MSCIMTHHKLIDSVLPLTKTEHYYIEILDFCPEISYIKELKKSNFKTYGFNDVISVPVFKLWRYLTAEGCKTLSKKKDNSISCREVDKLF